MVDKLSMFEEGQSVAQEQIALIKTEFESLAQDNKEVKKVIADLTELFKREILQRNKDQNLDPPKTTPVSHSPHTPTHFATVNDSTSDVLSKSRSVNWEGIHKALKLNPLG